MRFTKMQALGNDFVALNGFALPEADWRALSMAMCDRHFGVGADGLFVALPSQVADARMLFFNPDGTEDRCGNGLRCFGRFLHDEGITQRAELTVETFGGLVSLHVDAAAAGPVTADLGQPVLDGPGIPMALPPGPALHVPVKVGGQVWTVHAVSTGTPHAVLPVEVLPDEDTFQRVSPALENHPLFPEKTSVMWTQWTGAHGARVRIWERAVGETLGCGTGAAAVAVVARLLGRSDGPVEVVSRGGAARAAWDGGASVTLSGPASVVFTGHYTGPTRTGPPPRPET